MNPERAVGPPDGKTLALSRDTWIVVRFYRPIVDGPGPDLGVHELGPNDEAHASIAVSEDGERFGAFEAFAQAGRTTLFDLEEVGLAESTYVRVLGLDSAPPAETDDPGFDLDALEALR
ncbi:MAG: hypothetical protein HYV07_04930 [Deltaproteobacteria bacterium]|nr:hypothetical protein [Deltaproteobacteria bacterium]